MLRYWSIYMHANERADTDKHTTVKCDSYPHDFEFIGEEIIAVGQNEMESVRE